MHLPTLPHGCMPSPQSGRVAASGQDMGVHHTGECSDEDLQPKNSPTASQHLCCQAVVTVWRIPSPFVFPSACCTSTSPAACLTAGLVPQGPASNPFLGADVVCKTVKAIQTESVWLPFAYVEATAQLSNVVVSGCGWDRACTGDSWLGESTYKQASTCLKVPIPAKPLLT